ncbi:oxidoreductase [Actinoplanes sp. NBRC 103695]|uniref:oxidoreductase n=1 Tax=Actinoplanes sp. NBRC 103695 TaxID=3032202 RepID=UPI0024A04987|nr:oxidoreductase [Actinoplanes sp. NBRC 103695]GLY97418.1 oxidoreductase [Actinoplanes sp. NBRC 103695]
MTHWTPDDIGDLTGRTALVTGANSGIGLHTARHLAAHGARVLLAGRDGSRLETAATAIRTKTPGADLVILEFDLSDLASIEAAAGTVTDLDLLINNAGVMNVPERRTTADGFELTFGTNHLGHFALTSYLMPVLRRAPAARIVTVSAVAARWPSAALTDLMSERSYRPMTAYAKSKRANIVFTLELARRLDGTPMRAIAVHPGSAMTNLQQHTRGGFQRLLLPLLSRVAMGSEEAAAWPSLFAATDPGVPNGAFLGPAGRRQDSGAPKPARLPRGATDPEAGAALWSASGRLLAGAGVAG